MLDTFIPVSDISLLEYSLWHVILSHTYTTYHDQKYYFISNYGITDHIGRKASDILPFRTKLTNSINAEHMFTSGNIVEFYSHLPKLGLHIIYRIVPFDMFTGHSLLQVIDVVKQSALFLDEEIQQSIISKDDYDSLHYYIISDADPEEGWQDILYRSNVDWINISNNSIR